MTGVGPPLSDPAESIGARIRKGNDDEKKSKLAQAFDVAREEGDTVVERGAELAQDIRALIQAKNPDMCIPVSGSYPEVGVPPTEMPDYKEAAGSILDTVVFLVDVAVVGYRKVRRRA